MSIPVRAKKHLGQHFLTDRNIARKIVNSLRPEGKYDQVLEIGPGMGILTELLLENEQYQTTVIDIDAESVNWLQQHFPRLENRIIHADFLRFDIGAYFKGQVGIIGNFPYNISSQILFKVLEHREQVPELTGMFQKEVAERVAAAPGSKTYGILSVLLQAFYDIEYLFTVNPGVFNPPPKVRSGVIRLERKKDFSLDCDEKLFFEVVKAAFNQRRKTLRNALSRYSPAGKIEEATLQLRAERLSVKDFADITRRLLT
ncbi:dimethyladenosine transferase [Anseongella ginsenosidimutans]|uniref:Ribosomal RNA small subunit methyltransferase A n=1 Tax=Anseongella ginsenosidimutans TaxID=496056 RepID=A0A4R3KPQ4_9SPHI|nr:16S rRNA (adenine(1518)-N(6)/adenine(1519)-N(6))-dimethyltransferase RsmA [Anseongella ginsenosidimutans]QEC52182.1 16S rRNA (adenine(1518)-N(6)/adenine(1519)-N(6))-dimethyltransferase RsmA [Anseongella ginsenosidimutans]TCS86724.1 dimethyladenosine transferase [Anseongella ginsenosidimutans]